MTIGTRGVAEEQLAVEMENALTVPEKFFLKMSPPEPTCEWLHSECAAPQETARANN